MLCGIFLFRLLFLQVPLSLQLFVGLAECLILGYTTVYADFIVEKGNRLIIRDILICFFASYFVPTAVAYLSEDRCYATRPPAKALQGKGSRRKDRRTKDSSDSAVESNEVAGRDGHNDVEYYKELYELHAHNPAQLCRSWNTHLASRQLVHGPSGSLYYKSCQASENDTVSFGTIGNQVCGSGCSGFLSFATCISAMGSLCLIFRFVLTVFDLCVHLRTCGRDGLRR